MSDLSMLLDMGFPQHKAEKALLMTGNKGVEPAMEWLLAHMDSTEEQPVEKKTTCGTKSDYETSAAVVVDEKDDTEDVIRNISEDNCIDAKSIKCDECNRKFRTDSEIEFHAVKTGHQSFSQSSEEIKPLTEEEKQEQIRKVESLIKQRRAEKAEQEKREALEKEKTRRKTGQELTHARQRLLEEEIKNLAELKRKEKLEAKMARQRVLDEIERDKQARREKFGMGGATPSPITIANTVVPQQTPDVETTYDECRLQIRLTNGQCLTHKFSPNEELAAVRLFVEMNRTDGPGPFSLMTNFPKKVFTECDMNAPLSSLGLVPSAVLIVIKQQ